MKAIAWIASAIAVVVLLGTAHTRERVGSTPDEKQEESARKIRELQKQRVAVLRDVADVSAALYSRGKATTDETLQAQQLLLKAEVETARAAADRIKLYESAVASLTALEKIARAKKDAAQATEADVLKVKASRLEAEIAMERAKAGN